MRIAILPTWPGFAMNSLFYTALFGGIVAAHRALQRRARERANTCPECRYDASGLERCPECGLAAVHAREGLPRAPIEAGCQ